MCTYCDHPKHGRFCPGLATCDEPRHVNGHRCACDGKGDNHPRRSPVPS